MKNIVLEGFAFNLNYAHKLVGDVPEEKMCDLPGGLRNHPTWLIGHLAISCDFTALMLGRQQLCPPAWNGLFGMNTEPISDPSKYPEKKTLIDLLEQGHQGVAKAYEQASDSLLSQPTPDEGLRKMFPAVGQAVFFTMIPHESLHLGQLAVWRQVAGLPPALTG